MSLLSMLQAVTEARLRFVVVGGVAARLHGSARQTDDLDLCYDAERGNVDRLTAMLASWRAYPRGWEEAGRVAAFWRQLAGVTSASVRGIFRAVPTRPDDPDCPCLS